MPDITRLAESWLAEAGGSTSPDWAAAKVDCANELEKAWHEHAHDGEWREGCRICEDERIDADGS
jgi:ribulose kinase